MYSGPLSAEALIGVFSSQSDIDTIDPVPYYLDPLGVPGTVLSFLGSVGKVVINIVYSFTNYLPVWGVVGIAIAIFFLIMYVIVSSAVAFSADDADADGQDQKTRKVKQVAKPETSEDEGVRKRRGRSSSKSRATGETPLSSTKKDTPSKRRTTRLASEGEGAAKASPSRSSSRTTRSSRN